MRYSNVAVIALSLVFASDPCLGQQRFDVRALAKKSVDLKREPSEALYQAASEVQAGTVIDFAVNLPPSSTIKSVQVYAKNGSGITTQQAAWQPCNLQATLHRCKGVHAGYADSGFVVAQTDYGLIFQARIVPDSGRLVRGRLVVFYDVGSQGKP
jgi:hypothetical protein